MTPKHTTMDQTKTREQFIAEKHKAVRDIVEKMERVVKIIHKMAELPQTNDIGKVIKRAGFTVRMCIQYQLLRNQLLILASQPYLPDFPPGGIVQTATAKTVDMQEIYKFQTKVIKDINNEKNN